MYLQKYLDSNQKLREKVGYNLLNIWCRSISWCDHIFSLGHNKLFHLLILPNQTLIKRLQTRNVQALYCDHNDMYKRRIVQSHGSIWYTQKKGESFNSNSSLMMLKDGTQLFFLCSHKILIQQFQVAQFMTTNKQHISMHYTTNHGNLNIFSTARSTNASLVVTPT